MKNEAGIHQVVVAAATGDAITNAAIGLREMLRATGPSEIYAEHIAPGLRGDVLPLQSYRPAHANNLLVLHVSIGEPSVFRFVMNRPEQVVMMYHNITPARFFEPYDTHLAGRLALGRLELQHIAGRVACAIAASEFNARELEELGYTDVRVAPPVLDFERLGTVTPDPHTLARLRACDSPLLLSVGQLLPHKRPDFLVEMMHCLQSQTIPGARLVLAGHHRLGPYAQAIGRQIRELNVRVELAGSVDDADLAAMYTAATLVVTASEHEGFCVPLTEAMMFGTPIVARACAAVPETVGDAAMLLPEGAGPALFAEAVNELVHQPPLQHELIRRGEQRLAELARVGVGVELVRTLLEVA